MSEGAFGMSGFDLETTVRARVAITTLVINDGAMSTCGGAQDMIGPARALPAYPP